MLESIAPSASSLPFVGRRRELERLVSFWRGTVEAHGLRAMLMSGAAGSGKSRLVEEFLPMIGPGDGTVVHTKLFPEASTSLVPLLAAALSPSGDPMPGETTVSTVVAALRRLSRLRQTLVVIEDVHLLSRESIGELVLLLASLADEPISLLCSARPLEAGARGVLERYLVDEIEVGPIGREDLEELWRRRFGTPADAGLIGLISDLTLGNPLAIGSALRRVEGNGRDDADQAIPALRIRLTHDVKLLSEGMAAHLTDQELTGARALAILGEVFSREAARIVHPDADRTIESLMSAGILSVPGILASPLGTDSSAFPLLSFTHTLLHRHLVDSGTADARVLATLIASSVPLYSILPFQLLVASPAGAEELDRETLESGVRLTLVVARWLDIGADWELAPEVWRTAEALAEILMRRLDDDGKRNLRAMLVIRKLALLRRALLSEEYGALLQEMGELTVDPSDLAGAENRLLFHLYEHRLATQRDYPRCQSIWVEVERLVERLPDARFTQRYLEYLRDIVHFAVPRNDMTTVRRVERRIEELLGDERATPGFQRIARVSIYRNLLPVFETREELERRIAHLEELERDGGWSDRNTQLKKILLLEKTGRLDDALKLSHQAIPQFQERGLLLSVITIRCVQMTARAAFGESSRQIAAEVIEIDEGLNPQTRDLLRTHFGLSLGTIALLRGEEKSMEETLRRFISEDDREEGDDRGIIPLALGDSGGAGKWLAEAGAGDQADGIAAIIATPLLTLKSIVRRLAAIGALEEMDGEAAAGRCREGLLEALEWLAERGLFAFMTPVIDRLERYLPPEEILTWRARADAMQRARHGEAEQAPVHRKPRLSMLGRIELVRPDGAPPTRPRGARLRTLLGVMVATEMLDRPLSNREFYTLAAGEEDLDRARNTVYAAMHRLRESVGHDIILGDGETPHLNLDLVDVDLLEAQALLNEARRSAHDGALMKATRAVMAALETTNGEVAFPTLYDPFFAAARADFEQDIATTALAVARLLLREGDRDTAMAIITRASAMLPDNEELKEAGKV